MRSTPVLLAAMLTTVPLGGCAQDLAGYPSLAPRAAEKVGFDEPAVVAAPPIAADPALDARLRELGGKLDAVIRGYDTDAARARTAAAASGARTVGSEGWLTAQTALAALDDWRAQASAIATDAAVLASDRIGAVGQPYPALDALQARASAEAERESRATATIAARLPTP